MKIDKTNFGKFFGKAFVSVYLIILFAFVILIPVSGGWSLLPLFFLSNPFIIVLLPYISEIFYDLDTKMPSWLYYTLIPILGIAINLLSFYLIGYITGLICEKVAKLMLNIWRTINDKSRSMR